MLEDIMNNISFLKEKLLSSAFLTAVLLTEISAQTGQNSETESGGSWLYILLYLITLGGGGAILWWMRKKRLGTTQTEAKAKGKTISGKKTDPNAVDFDKGTERYLNHQKSNGKKETKNYPKNLPQAGNILSKKVNPAVETANEEVREETITMERGVLRDKMMKIQFSQLPISSFKELRPAREYDLLSISNNGDLVSAIEQASDEYEEDEQVRDLSVRILAAFKTRNSIESLTQIALYDVSSNLRSKAVGILADFDHESVFETVLLACADPSREVRATAARGLFRLSFDRADAWKRIAETGDEFRMRQAARAATEADLVKRSFERLIHDDLKMAYEAFTFTALMIKAGETAQLFETIETHRDNNVKFALLYILKVVRDESALSGLYNLLEQDSLSPELKEQVDETIKSFEMVAA